MLILSPQDVTLAEIHHPETQKRMPVLTYQSQRFGLVRKFELSDRQGAMDFSKNLVTNHRKFCILLEEAHQYSVWGRLRPLTHAPSAAQTQKVSEQISTLFTRQEWAAIAPLPEEQFSQALLKKLNQQRKLLGEIALKTIHSHPSAQYRRTASVFVAYRDGGGLTYGFIIHWFRELALGVGKNLTTKIGWDVINKQHFKATVVEDESVFSPSNAEGLDQLFKNLLP